MGPPSPHEYAKYLGLSPGRVVLLENLLPRTKNKKLLFLSCSSNSLIEECNGFRKIDLKEHEEKKGRVRTQAENETKEEL
ncbi:hypothetical protein BDY24DRAFT_404051, partial [Mrakia frigida]|uniref:uncharacterized protein n=1 Tax=Mrakia frigida TaxID=29902 RepID=UPI003FCC1059